MDMEVFAQLVCNTVAVSLLGQPTADTPEVYERTPVKATRLLLPASLDGYAARVPTYPVPGP